MREKGCDYFENSRRGTYVQREYATRNPHSFIGYGEDRWGLSAGDGASVELRLVAGRRQAQEYGFSQFYLRDDFAYWSESDLIRSRSTGKNSCSNQGLRWNHGVLRAEGCGNGRYLGANSRHALTVSVSESLRRLPRK